MLGWIITRKTLLSLTYSKPNLHFLLPPIIVWEFYANHKLQRCDEKKGWIFHRIYWINLADNPYFYCCLSWAYESHALCLVWFLLNVHVCRCTFSDGVMPKLVMTIIIFFFTSLFSGFSFQCWAGTMQVKMPATPRSCIVGSRVASYHKKRLIHSIVKIFPRFYLLRCIVSKNTSN